MDRFWSKVDKSESCWIFTASGNKWGYGQFWYQGKFTGAHRFSYFLEHGEIKSKLEIHHICRNRRCVNPKHLEAISRQEHNRRWRNLAPSIEATKKRYADRTECLKGHLLTKDNTRVYINTSGYTERRCKTCHREREAAKRKRE